MSAPLKAPFPWFGGKSRVAHEVWARFGHDVPNYVEPFAGSLAVLLGRPGTPRIETVNDLDYLLANFWRAVQSAPDTVAHYADWPVNECDLHARHVWLVQQKARIREALYNDPHAYDAQVAGYWLWGICQWIGSGWCAADTTDKGISNQLPVLDDGGKGVHSKRPNLGGRGNGYSGKGILASTKSTDSVYAWMAALQQRLRYVRVVCGDWQRVCTPAVTSGVGLTGILLDPPYGDDRRDGVYSTDSYTVAAQVRDWCLANGDDPSLRIALCGYEGEHDVLEANGWRVMPWKTNGGYANKGNGGSQGRANRYRERIWFSPHCLTPNPQLF
jgi:hypothetical protein